MTTLDAQDRRRLEWIAQTMLSIGKDLFPSGYVRDVYAWENPRSGALMGAWVMKPERLARVLNADGEHHLPFRGGYAAYIIGRKGGDPEIFKHEREMGAFDFLDRMWSAMPKVPPEVLGADEYLDARLTFLSLPGYPWPAGGGEYYSAVKNRWIRPERPEWLLPERIVDESRNLDHYGVDLCKLFEAEFGHRMGAVLARYGARPGQLFMATHAMGGRWGPGDAESRRQVEAAAASINRCGGFLFPSLALGPIPATNFGPFVLIADVGVVLNGLTPFKGRGRSLVHVYSSDAWTGRTSDFLNDVAITAYEQMHGDNDYMNYMDLNVWQLGPDPDAPELFGPGVAERITRVAQLKRELAQRFRVWRRDLDPAQIQHVIEEVAMTKARYGYLEAKVAGVLPMREFPLAVAPRGQADLFAWFLDETGFEGELLEVELPEEVEQLMHLEREDSFDALNAALRAFFASSEEEAQALMRDFEKRQAIQTWADMQYGWHVLDEVRAYTGHAVELR